VTEDDDFDGQFVLSAKRETDQLDDANERHVEEGECHASILAATRAPTKVQVDSLDDVFGTHTLTLNGIDSPLRGLVPHGGPAIIPTLLGEA
jgi:hypothetical protein